MPFALTSSPSTSEISDAINYLLNNFGSNVSIDLTTGIIAGPSGRISNLYKYIQIKYATSYDGTVGFSNVPTSATYYGIRNNNDPTESLDPNDYVWYKTTGFGTTNFLWYIVAGGRQIDFYISPTQPSDYYVKDPGTAIDIDIVTTTKTVNVAYPAIFIWTSGSTPTRPTTTSTYTWATASYSAPSGWSTTPPSDTTPGDTLWQIRVPITANSNVLTSIIDWTNTSYQISQVSSNGTSGTPGATGATGLSAITAYKVQVQTASNPTFTTPTSGNSSPTGWYSSVSAALSAVGLSSFTPGYVLWYIFGQYNSTGSSISGVPANSTAWTGPTAASIFQDIQSDNWDGSVPPTYTNSSTWGTQGYYLRQGNTTGSPSAIYINNGIFRGNITTLGQASFGGANSSGSFKLNIGSTLYPMYYSTFSKTPLSTPAVTGDVNVGVLGLSNTISGGSYNVGVAGVGVASSSIPSIGVVGSAETYGGYFIGGSSGLVVSTTFTGGNALFIQQGNIIYGTVTINVPPGTSTTFLAGDGNWYPISSITAGVSSFNGRTGVVTLTSGDVTTALGYTPPSSAVSSFNSRTGAVSLSSGDVTGALGFTPYNSSNPSGYVTASTSSLSNYSTTSVTQSYINSYAAHQFNADSGTAFVSSGNLNIYVSITGFQSSGSGNTITIQNVSDRRLKENITPEVLGLGFIKQLNPVSYNMIKGAGRKMHGFIAQDIEPLITDDNDALKITNEDGSKGVDYLSLIAPMVKSIQELSTKVDELQQKIIALEAKL